MSLSWMLLVIAGCVSGTVSGDTGQVEDGPGEALAVISDDYTGLAQGLIGQARDHVHVIEFVIYEGGAVDVLLDALLDAAARGVEVKLLADETGSGTVSALDRLSAGGVQTSLDSPQTTTHNKLIIADDATLVGSHNFTNAALSANNEASVLVRDVGVSAWYEDYFQQLWLDSDHSPDLDPTSGEHMVPIQSRELPPYLLDCLGSARTRVRLVLYAFSYSAQYPDGDLANLATALEDAWGRGVDVRLVLDGSEWVVDNHINDEAIARLRAAGLPLRTTALDQVTHAKVLVCDDTAIVGDANWSYSSFEYYNGTSVQVQDATVAAEFVAWSDALWASADP